MKDYGKTLSEEDEWSMENYEQTLLYMKKMNEVWRTTRTQLTIIEDDEWPLRNNEQLCVRVEWNMWI